MILILVRHGETLENLEGRIQGHSNGNLSPVGINQALQISKILKTKKIDIILASDLKRAKDTAAPIIKNRKNVPVVYTSLLRERGYGELEGEYKKSVLSVKDLMLFSSPDAESIESLYGRTVDFLNYVLQSYSNKCVLVISHNGFIRMFFTMIAGKPCNNIVEMNNFENASISEINFTSFTDYKVLSYNSPPTD